ncbi:hypothetical protein [uncultured Duncaniella sp.]|uniref:hypothetical protein n=1 Tax=uncultured Duncaniella sp. TaxID=2768039 RepID=UPI0026272C28|nr:hypothetical protein [uncultured Duncaniella sp.]
MHSHFHAQVTGVGHQQAYRKTRSGIQCHRRELRAVEYRKPKKGTEGHKVRSYIDL